MKKILLAIFLLAAIFFAFCYWGIPTQIRISKSVMLNTNANSINRVLNTTTKWKEWWPDNNAELKFNDISYKPILPAEYVFPVIIEKGSNVVNSTLSVTNKGDSCLLTWYGAITNTVNPFTRIKNFLFASNCEANMVQIINRISTYIINTKNVYGISVTNEQLKDTLLVNTQQTFSRMPATNDVYALINKLRIAIKKENVEPTNNPMMNITKLDSSEYLLRVAIPVSKRIKEGDGVVLKFMFPGRILVSNEIHGGAYTANNAFDQMHIYALDYGKSSPAIPFQSLITDRQIEPDTTKWVTRIFYPVY